jgi:hypothetical protein
VWKVTFGGASSLDHYLARPDGAVDWLMWGPVGEIRRFTNGCVYASDRVLY